MIREVCICQAYFQSSLSTFFLYTSCCAALRAGTADAGQVETAFRTGFGERLLPAAAKQKQPDKTSQEQGEQSGKQPAGLITYVLGQSLQTHQP